MTMAKARILVVYYSRTGTTRKVAQSLSAALSCDSEEITEAGSRNGIFGYLRSAMEARRQIPSRIAATVRDPSLYDLVVIGTPVWAWSLSSPVRAYLLANRSKLPAVAFFCTLGGAGSDQVFGQMRELVGKQPLDCLFVTARDVASANDAPRLATFVEAIQRAIGNGRSSAATNAG
ncbi:MAG: flavodoxin [Bradyrhizobium sp.]|uniref:flavodoxin family protein n=1 Tax=Bradyrhizobium sp. TaxID=376 RepID=UPI00299FFD68|nr:flavodoxin [Bradyrhizobium sp.]MDX3968764.1 flavodoxin [Bradyrhizobium sp.]